MSLKRTNRELTKEIFYNDGRVPGAEKILIRKEEDGEDGEDWGVGVEGEDGEAKVRGGEKEMLEVVRGENGNREGLDERGDDEEVREIILFTSTRIQRIKRRHSYSCWKALRERRKGRRKR